MWRRWAGVKRLAHCPEKLPRPSKIRRLASLTGQRLDYLLDLIDLRRHDEVAFREAIDCVCPEGDGGLTPAEQDVGMMTLFFGQRPDAVYEVERFLEIREAELAGDVVLVNYLPVGKLVAEGVQFGTLEGRGAAATGNAVPGG